jgi:hypothetical protein
VTAPSKRRPDCYKVHNSADLYTCLDTDDARTGGGKISLPRKISNV